jgi:hypothetical protein
LPARNRSAFSGPPPCDPTTAAGQGRPSSPSSGRLKSMSAVPSIPGITVMGRKPGVDPTSGISLGDVLILPKRHPACRRREARPGSGTERENLAGDGKGKGASGSNREAESTDAPERGGLPRSSYEAAVMVVERRGGSPPLGWVNRQRCAATVGRRLGLLRDPEHQQRSSLHRRRLAPRRG